MKTEVRSLSYNSQGALPYNIALLLSAEDRLEWIQYISNLREKDDKFVQEKI